MIRLPLGLFYKLLKNIFKTDIMRQIKDNGCRLMYANKSQLLIEHSIAVAMISSKIVDRLDFEPSALGKKIPFTDKKNIKKLAFLGGLFHDMGKADPAFQDYISSEKKETDSVNGVHIDNKKFSFEDHPRHNEISWFVIDSIFTNRDLKLNAINFRILKNIILWHHAAPLRKVEFDSSTVSSALRGNADFVGNIKCFLNSLCERVNEISSALEFSLDLELVIDELENLFSSSQRPFPDYKEHYSSNNVNLNIDDIRMDIINEATTSLLRSVIITADRYVSSAKGDICIDKIVDNIFSENIYSQMKSSIEKMEKTFFPDSERSLLQGDAARKLADIKKVSILNGPAGAGKTKISLQWCANTNADKVYYIAPRTIICEELYVEIKDKYLPHGVSVELVTSDKKLRWDGKKEHEIVNEDFFSSDINITTLDQVAKSITTHKNISILFDLIMSNVIFDEYHEYYKLSGLDLLFAEIIELKSAFVESKTLLMSATPNFFMLKNFLEVYDPRSSISRMVDFKTTNNKEFSINVVEYDECTGLFDNNAMFVANGDDGKYKLNNDIIKNEKIVSNPFLSPISSNEKTIVITNTATMAQMSFLMNSDREQSMLAHSKFKKEDKLNSLAKIKESFGQISSEGYSVLRAGPIVQASLNITSEKLITEMSNAENTLQRLGRLNRFADDFVGKFVVAVPENVFSDEIKGSAVLNNLSLRGERRTSLLWIKYLREKLLNGNNSAKFKLSEIYGVYRDFYFEEDVSVAMMDELIASLKKSYQNIKYNILNPVEIVGKKTKGKSSPLSKHSLRGKGIYATMAVYDVSCGGMTLTDSYITNVNLPRDVILTYSENYALVRECVKNHELLYADKDRSLQKLLAKAKKEKSDKYYRIVLDQSRDEEFNIYASFSKKDMVKFNSQENDDKSIVYIVSNGQSVGYLKLKKLIG